MNDHILLVSIIIILTLASIIIYTKFSIIKREYGHSLDINKNLIDISNELCHINDINEFYKRMLQYTINMIKGAEYGSITVYNKSEDRMEFAALSGYDINLLSAAYLKKEELFLYTLNKLTEPGIIINPLSHKKRYYNSYEEEILKNSNQLIYKSVLSAPLYIDGEFFGCLSVDNINSTNAFSKKDIVIIKYICNHMEIVIKNMLLMEGLKKRMITDTLTGLFNRRYYASMVECNFQNKNLADATFVMIDMDNFKAINDTYGHDMGDEALKYFSNLLKSRFRKCDTLIRYAGDEFLLVLYDCDERNAVRILASIEKELSCNPLSGMDIRFSYGISRFTEGSSIKDAVFKADQNMYMQKAAKKKAV